MSAQPSPPDGYQALRTGADGGASLLGPHHPTQVTHLIVRQSQGTLCGKTLFDRGEHRADIPGWSVGGGVSGPGYEQVACAECFALAAPVSQEPPKEDA